MPHTCGLHLELLLSAARHVWINRRSMAGIRYVCAVSSEMLRSKIEPNIECQSSIMAEETRVQEPVVVQ